MLDFVVIALTFGPIFVVELPDKTFIAALVLSTRYQPLLVWIGVGLAFGLQTLIAVTAGSFVSLLPEAVVKAVSIAVFLLGAVLLFRAAAGADAEEREAEYAAGTSAPQSGLKVIGSSFLVLFAAEWGDLSQLMTVSRAAEFREPLSVFLGAWGALLAVSGLAVLVGRILLRHMRLSVLHYLGSAVCLTLAASMLHQLLS
ncbi:MAG: TMEM165/GDT1 family protein [Actinomycetota bacterium]|nr:TMEM165/GDT1 family protein [Actinomycetota bacterium]